MGAALGGVRTDLAIEVRDLLMRETGREVSGVEIKNEETEAGLVSRVTIRSVEAGKAMGKLPGRYVTVESQSMREHDRATQEGVAKLFSKELSGFLTDVGEHDTVLVVGLGNWNSTPDALGPRVVHHVLVTRHLFSMSAPEKWGGLRPVCGIAPGVLGTTGMETGEIVRGVVDRVKPKLVIAVDALAARSTGRVCSTIQISDTGISPGAGIGNKRVGITEETLGVKVVAVGVPTVVHASTIVGDGMDMLTNRSQSPAAGGGKHEEDPGKAQAIQQVLAPFIGDLIVTPKEIDVLIDDTAKLLAAGMNAALHTDISWDEMYTYLE
jgi:spore protease